MRVLSGGATGFGCVVKRLGVQNVSCGKVLAACRAERDPKNLPWRTESKAGVRNSKSSVGVHFNEYRLLDAALQPMRPQNVVLFLRRLNNWVAQITKQRMKLYLTVESDGGTSCNIPAKGYGLGYGSFRIDGGKIQRRKFGNGYSNNAAEIEIITEALQYIGKHWEPNELTLTFCSDSEIALKWLKITNSGQQVKIGKKTSEGMKRAVDRLRTFSPRFQKIVTQWQPRKESVKAFGH